MTAVQVYLTELNGSNYELNAYLTDGTYLRTVYSSVDQFTDCKVDSAGNKFLLGFGAQVIYKVHNDESIVDTWDISSLNSLPSAGNFVALALSPDESTLYVTAEWVLEELDIAAIDTATGTIGTITQIVFVGNPGSSDPWSGALGPFETGLAVDAAGNFYFGNGDLGTDARYSVPPPYWQMIAKYTPSAVFSNFGPFMYPGSGGVQGMNPRTYAIHPSGDILAGTRIKSGNPTTGNHIYRIAPSGSVVDHFNDGAGYSNRAMDLQLDPDDSNTLWIGYGRSDSPTGRVVTLDLTTGTFTELFSSPHGGFDGFAVSSILPPDFPCLAVDFTAQCGDVLAAFCGDTCWATECWRPQGTTPETYLRIGRLTVAARPLTGTMCLDRSGYLYIPFVNDLHGGTVQRFGNGTPHHYTSTPTSWFTPPVTNEIPISISADSRNRIYVLVIGGDADYALGTYLRLYQLTTAGTVTATYNLPVPSGHQPYQTFNAGSYVDPDGTRFLYGSSGDTTQVVAAFDLVNNVALADFFVDATGASFSPNGGLRFFDTRVLVTNYASPLALLRDFAGDASSHVDWDGGIQLFGGDVEIPQREGAYPNQHVLVSDPFGSYNGDPVVLLLNLADGTVSLAFDINEAMSGTNTILLAAVCGGSVPKGHRGYARGYYIE